MQSFFAIPTGWDVPDSPSRKLYYTELRHKVTFYTQVKMYLCAAAEYI